MLNKTEANQREAELKRLRKQNQCQGQLGRDRLCGHHSIHEMLDPLGYKCRAEQIRSYLFYNNPVKRL